MARLFNPIIQNVDGSGEVRPGQKMLTFDAGTTTPKVTYTDAALTIPHSNPIIADANGKFPDVFLELSGYKLRFTDANDVQYLETDGVFGTPDIEDTVQQTQRITAAADQTTFNLTNSYTPGASNLIVFINGTYQYPPANYIETDSSTITFTSPLEAGDLVDVITAVQRVSGSTDASQVTYTNGVSGTVSLNVQSKFREFINVKDFGATGDGVTDDTGAFNALTSYARTQVDAGNARNTTANIIIPPGRYSISSWDLTAITDRQINILGSGAVLIANTAAKNVVDMTQSRFMKLSNLVIYSSAGVEARSGIQMGPKGTETVGNNLLENVFITGHWADAALMNLGSETTQFENCNFIQLKTNSTLYAAVFDGQSVFIPTSDYVTVTRTPGTGLSFTNNGMNGTQFRNEGGGSSVYLIKTEGFNFDASSYFLTFNNSALDLYGTGSSRNKGLYIRGQFENSQNDIPTPGNIGIRTCVRFVGDGTNTAIDGLTIESFGAQCEEFALKNDTGGGTVRISNANLRIVDLARPGAVWFDAGTGMFVDGEIFTNEADKLNLGSLNTFNGTISLNDYTALPSEPSSGSYTVYDRVNGEVYNKGTHVFVDAPGSFTPTITFATPGDLSVAYSKQTGNFYKVDKVVHFSISLAFTPTFSTASGELRISGLSPAGAVPAGQRYNFALSTMNSSWAWPAGATQSAAYIPSNSTLVRVQGIGTGAASSVFTATELTSGAAHSIEISGTYLTT